jgi:hypothetical protein
MNALYKHLHHKGCYLKPDNDRAMPSARAATPSVEWRQIVGYEGLYDVSNDGRVRNARRMRELSPVADTCGYPTVKLCRNNLETRYSIHRLVCRAFRGIPFAGAQVAHLNGNPADNRAENLKWVTCAENNSHKAIHGTRQIGARNGRSKYTGKTIETVREMHRGGFSEKKIAELTGVSKSHVHRVVAWETWND